jgi:hypothetical protein
MSKATDLKQGLTQANISFKFQPEGYEAFLTDKRKKNQGDKPKKGRPRTAPPKDLTGGNTPETGTKLGERRATYIVKKEVIEKIHAIAQLESHRETVKNKEITVVMVKEVVGQALQEYIDKYEKKYGAIKPLTKK